MLFWKQISSLKSVNSIIYDIYNMDIFDLQNYIQYEGAEMW